MPNPRFDGAAARSLAKARGFTLKGLGDLMGRRSATVGAWFAGRIQPKASDLGRLADLLDVDPGELFTRERGER